MRSGSHKVKKLLIIELQYYKKKQKLSSGSQNNLNVQHIFSNNLIKIKFKTYLSISNKLKLV